MLICVLFFFLSALAEYLIPEPLNLLCNALKDINDVISDESLSDDSITDIKWVCAEYFNLSKRKEYFPPFQLMNKSILGIKMCWNLIKCKTK